MAQTTKISWCDATLNFWWGCTKVSPGCARCYADTLAHRFGKDIWGKGKSREDHRASATKLAHKLDKKAKAEGRRLRVFSFSMSDWLDDEVPIEWLADLLKLIHDTPNLIWLLLTKRPQNWRGSLNGALECGQLPLDAYNAVEHWRDGNAPNNVWIGTSVEDQTRADERIPLLLQIPAKVRFLSLEPLLGSVKLWEYGFCEYGPASVTPGKRSIDWCIVGAESGKGARPMQVEWAQLLRDQCAAASVPFFLKQMVVNGKLRHELSNFPPDLQVREFPQP